MQNTAQARVNSGQAAIIFDALTSTSQSTIAIAMDFWQLEKLMPRFAALLGEAPKSMLDVLAYAEKMRWIDSAEAFISATPSLRQSDVLFGNQSDFHVYDMVPCCSAKRVELGVGALPIALTHQSKVGSLHSPLWQTGCERYLKKLTRLLYKESPTLNSEQSGRL
jgi:hypothetical protein